MVSLAKNIAIKRGFQRTLKRVIKNYYARPKNRRSNVPFYIKVDTSDLSYVEEKISELKQMFNINSEESNGSILLTIKPKSA